MRSMLEVYIKDAKNFQKFGQYDLAIEALEQAQKIDSQHQFEVEIQKLLTLWLKEVPEFASLFCIMSLLGALIDTMTMGLVEANKAVGNIRKFMLWIATPKLVVLPISWILLKLNFGIIIVVLFYLLVETFTMLIRLPLLRESAGLDTVDFCKGVFGKIIVPTLASVIICTLSVVLFESTWRILLTYIASTIAFLVCAYMTSLEDNEKALIQRIFNKVKDNKRLCLKKL